MTALCGLDSRGGRCWSVGKQIHLGSGAPPAVRGPRRGLLGKRAGLDFCLILALARRPALNEQGLVFRRLPPSDSSSHFTRPYQARRPRFLSHPRVAEEARNVHVRP